MCFSPTASFTASIAVGTIGIATLRHVKNKRELPLALMPILFAIQQAIEGLLWLSLGSSGTGALPLTYAFGFFAFFLWPIYAPFTVYLLEPEAIRRKVMILFLMGGAVFSFIEYTNFISHHEAAQIVNHCIYYRIDSPFSTLFVILYGMATVGAGLFSSHKSVRVFTLLLGFSALISWRYYSVTFSSVWCFFAAVLSLVLLFYFRKTPAHRTS